MQIEMDIVSHHQNEYLSLNNFICLYLVDLIDQVIFWFLHIYVNNSHMGEWRVIIIVSADNTYWAHYRPSSLFLSIHLIMSIATEIRYVSIFT